MTPLPQPFKTAPRRVRRGRRAAVTSPAPAALVLAAASYDPVDGPSVTLAFNRAIDISVIDPTGFRVNDAVFAGNLYQGDDGSASLVSPTAVRLTLSPIDDSTGSVVTLSVLSGNGVVAADDSQAWPGVTDLDLPFP